VIFPDTERTFTGSALYNEPQYAYLQRSARPEAHLVRNLLEDWIQRYPVSEQRELIIRLQTNDFSSAFFEFYLHELLIRNGFDVDLHPDLEGTTKRPDFLVQNNSGEKFIVEAVLSHEESNSKQALKNQLKTVYDELNKLTSPNFFISIGVRRQGGDQPSARRIKNQLSSWMDTLDVDELWKSYHAGSIENFPRINIDESGWRFEFSVIPKSPAIRGIENKRPLGFMHERMRPSNIKNAIRDSLSKKASKYGKFDIPYIIAINVMGLPCDKIDIMESLFGTEQFTFETGEEVMQRAPDGFWYGPNGVKNTRVSGILVTSKLDVWNIPSKNLELYYNPLAEFPFTRGLLRVSEHVPENSNLILHEGIHPREIFNLSPDWPSVKKPEIVF